MQRRRECQLPQPFARKANGNVAFSGKVISLIAPDRASVTNPSDPNEVGGGLAHVIPY